jgi:glutaredoxin
MKKVFFAVAALVCLLAGSGLVARAADPAHVYLFYGEGCPHCAREKQFLSQLQQREPFDLHEFEVYYHPRNAALLKQVASALEADAGGVPFLVVGDQVFIGYAEGITDMQIERRIRECNSGGCPDSVAPIVFSDAAVSLVPEASAGSAPLSGQIQDTPEALITVPLLGTIEAKSFSLPLLTVVLGALDGFNPCAMWTLLFLISLLLGMRDRRRMWLLGGTFIAASAAVYFVFMAAWLNLLLFLGFVVWVRILIGALALGGGWYSLRKYFLEKNTCSIAGSERKQRVFEKLRSAVSQPRLWLALGGIVALAFAVNLVELVCSAGLPAVYTQVLALQGFTGWQYYAYMLAYIFFFMLDDLIVFVVAMKTLQLTGITTKYTKYTQLIGGMLMLLLGILLIAKPEWLMFG